MGILLDLAECLKSRSDLGFLFVGRGSDAQRLREDASCRQLDNVLFFDEIDPDEIHGLYAQCDIGLVALDHRHKTHNIPGKFISYMHCGLPVLATVNAGNDLVRMIESEQVGRVVTDNSLASLLKSAELLVEDVMEDAQLSKRCSCLANRLFSSEVVVQQIVKALQS